MKVWRVGVELELLAPVGRDRRDLAQAIAQGRPGSRVRRVFHQESEPSKVPGQPVFDNLTLGFEVVDADGQLVARFVDDLTLQSDLDRQMAPVPGWFRIVSDDTRLLRLAAHHARVEQPLRQALAPLAALFGTELEAGPGGMFRVLDDAGASVAIGAPLPGERQRPCEVITPPMTGDRATRITELVDAAVALGFLLPAEGAVHVHYDAAALREARVFRDLVRFFDRWGPGLRRMVRTNPNCRRLAPWPTDLRDLVESPGFAELSWDQMVERVLPLEPTKYRDFNIRNLILAPPDKDTFEVRILPATLDVARILASIGLFEAVLVALIDGEAAPGVAPDRTPRALQALLDALPLGDEVRAYWIRALAG